MHQIVRPIVSIILLTAQMSASGACPQKKLGCPKKTCEQQVADLQAQICCLKKALCCINGRVIALNAADKEKAAQIKEFHLEICKLKTAMRAHREDIALKIAEQDKNISAQREDIAFLQWRLREIERKLSPPGKLARK